MENVMNNKNSSPDELQHWGIKGMKWGVRRYQNKDGTLTDEGKARYSEDNVGETTVGSSGSNTVKPKRTNPLKDVDVDTYKVRALPDGVRCDRTVDYSSKKDTPTEKDINDQIARDKKFREENGLKEKTMSRAEAKDEWLTERSTDLVWASSDYATYASKHDPSYAKDAAVLYERSKKVAHKITDERTANYYKHSDSWLEAYWNYSESMQSMNHKVYDFDGNEDLDFEHSDLSDDELQHEGVKGMRWGVRRYQYKDGSLTPEGERRRKSLRERYREHKVAKKRKAALEKARAAKVAKKEAEEKAAKEAEKRDKAIKAGLIPVKKMTDKELADHINRLNNEKRYKELQIETSATKKLMNKMYNDAIIPGLTNAGKNIVDKYVTKTVSDYLGLDKKTKSEFEKLKEQADIAKLKKDLREYNDTEYQKLKADAEKSKWSKQILDDDHDKFFINEKLKAAKKGEVYRSPEEKEKLRKAEEAKAEKERKEAEAKAEKDKQEAERKKKETDEQTKADAQKQVDDYNAERERAESGKYGRNYRKGANVDETGSRTVKGLLEGPTASTKADNLPSTHVRSGEAEVYDSNGNFLYNSTYKELDD